MHVGGFVGLDVSTTVMCTTPSLSQAAVDVCFHLTLVPGFVGVGVLKGCSGMRSACWSVQPACGQCLMPGGCDCLIMGGLQDVRLLSGHQQDTICFL